jgi:multicomponent Na+:H+ antiporter subunit E
MIKYVVVWLVVFTVYITFAGSLAPYTVITGALVSTILSAVTSKYVVTNEQKLLQPLRLAYLVYYFLKYMTIIEMKAHVDVVKRIFTMDIRPGIVRVPVKARSSYARLLVMASITNTPGTVVVDEKGEYFYVNWIYVSTVEPSEARKAISEEFEHFAIKIFD